MDYAAIDPIVYVIITLTHHQHKLNITGSIKTTPLRQDLNQGPVFEPLIQVIN